jgi:putative transposase
VVYKQAIKQAEVNPAYYAGIAIGMDNLAALTSNKPGFVPVNVNGRLVKSINQYYNKRKAELQKQLGYTDTTKRMERLTNKRNRRIDLYMHESSRWIIDHLVKEGIGTLVISKNERWKQNSNMGKRINQNFVNIPHARFIEMLSYKGELVGITVLLTEESYTSKASFLDLDPLPVLKPDDKIKYTFSGKRIKRGLYRASDGRLINADSNGSYVRRFGAYQISPKGDEVEGNRPQGHPIYLMRKLKGENSMSGKRLNGKVCTMMRRKSCTHGEA